MVYEWGLREENNNTFLFVNNFSPQTKLQSSGLLGPVIIKVNYHIFYTYEKRNRKFSLAIILIFFF